eukprot:2107863-Rhodomonas_salina.4
MCGTKVPNAVAEQHHRASWLPRASLFASGRSASVCAAPLFLLTVHPFFDSGTPVCVAMLVPWCASADT